MNKIGMARVAFTVLTAYGLGIHATLAQDASSVTVDVGECVNLQSPEERFACYERQVDATRSAPAAAARPGSDSEADDAADGRSESSRNATTAATPDSRATNSQEFVATVTALRRTVPNSYVITLDNGQVWRQTYAEWYPLRTGLKVRVRPSRWGSRFWLSADQHEGYIQVERVR